MAPTAQQAINVYASYDDTWDAVIDHFAKSNILIRTIDKESGFIATARMPMPSGSGALYADCGKSALRDLDPTDVIYNVQVRHEGTHCTVLVTALFQATFKESWTERVVTRSCVSTHEWENTRQANIKFGAEQSD